MKTKELLENIKDFASNVSNNTEDHQAGDDCSTICQMIEDFLSENSEE